MKQRIMHIMNLVKDDKETSRSIGLLTITFAMLLIAIPVRDMLSSGRYIVSDDNSVVQLERQDDSKSCEYNLVLEIDGRDGITRRELTIRREADTGEADFTTRDSSNDEYSEAELRQLQSLEIDDIISSIESSEQVRVVLPDKLSDGSKLKWYRQNQSGRLMGLIMILYIAIVVIVIKNSLDKASKPLQKHREEIIAVLPRFVNQIVMMMDAGVILSDAFIRISKSYLLIEDEERNYFEKSIIRITDGEDVYNRSMAVKLSEFAKSEGIKELSRIARILLENERRGSDAQSNLRRESEFLWESRKIVASEKGKSIDTRMTFPLGMLLILLIVITMAPALMSM